MADAHKKTWPQEFAELSDSDAARRVNNRMSDLLDAMDYIIELWHSPDSAAKIEGLLKYYPQELMSFDDLRHTIAAIVFSEERRRPEYDGPKRRHDDNRGMLEVKSEEADVCPHCGRTHKPTEGMSGIDNGKVILTCAECGEDYFYIFK